MIAGKSRLPYPSKTNIRFHCTTNRTEGLLAPIKRLLCKVAVLSRNDPWRHDDGIDPSIADVFHRRHHHYHHHHQHLQRITAAEHDFHFTTYFPFPRQAYALPAEEIPQRSAGFPPYHPINTRRPCIDCETLIFRSKINVSRCRNMA